MKIGTSGPTEVAAAAAPVGWAGQPVPVIRVQSVEKTFRTYSAPGRRLIQMGLAIAAHFSPEPLRSRLRGKADRQYKGFTALRNINFDVLSGESIGIIGKNGSGKSTLLQILCGTLDPTHGSIEVTGRVAALLELGAGFNPEYSGRDNVMLNGELLGLTPDEIESRMASIEAFADIGDFIEEPARTYSSGMYMRLAFAVAAHTSPDVLVVDEALAVGDIRFQQKCIERMRELKESGTTILFVSHSPDQVKRFCDRAIWLHQGGLVLDGDSALVCDKYRDFMMSGVVSFHDDDHGKGTVADRPVPTALPAHHDVSATTPAHIRKVQINTNRIRPQEALEVTVDYEVLDPSCAGLLAGVAIYTSARQFVFGPNTHLEEIDIPDQQGVHRLVYRIERLPLLPGSFEIDVGVFVEKGLVALDYISAAARFEVHSDYVSEGLVYLEHSWEIVQ